MTTMRPLVSAVSWCGILAIYLLCFEILGHTVWVPNLPFLMVIVLGLYAARSVSLGVALGLAVFEKLTGSSQTFHLLWYPAVALGLNYFFYNVFRSHPFIFRTTHAGLILADVLLSWLWAWLVLQSNPVWQPVAIIIFFVSSSALTYLLRATGEGFFENRKIDKVWRKPKLYRMAFTGKSK